jgi:hypothetical protein
MEKNGCGSQARRALRTLKGLVRLQALIRGQAVRRQAAATLRGLESLFKIQARLHPDLLTRRGGRELYAAAVHVSRSLLSAGRMMVRAARGVQQQ